MMRNTLLWTTTGLALLFAGQTVAWAQDATKPVDAIVEVDATVEEVTPKVEAETTPSAENAETSTETTTAAPETAPAATEEAPAAKPEATASEDMAPTKVEPEAVKQEEAPASTTEAAKESTVAPETTTEAPTSTQTETKVETETPAKTEAAPAETTEAPAKPKSKPAAKAESPAETTQTNSAPATAESAPAVVVEENRTETQKAAAEEVEQQRRSKKRERRNELIGAGVAGIAVGALIQGALGGTVVEDEGDRLIVERDGRYFIRKDENELLRRDGVEVVTENLAQGRQRTTATRPNGVEVVTLRDRNGNILKRTKRLRNGDEIVLIDNQNYDNYQRVDYGQELGVLRLGIDRDQYIIEATRADRAALRKALMAEPVERAERVYSLREVRDSQRLRAKTRRVDLDGITFVTGSAAVTRSQVAKLEDIGNAMARIIADNPREVFLIEGHTDAVGSELSNLSLSDRRAETVARILIGNFDVPPENLIVEGYGETDLKVQTETAEQANRRVTVRRITPLLGRS